jgi:glycosyltransferase involved in cell wall biosynthesis
MRVIGFVEGACKSKGGFGLVGVQIILSGIARRGHEIALVLAGDATPGRERFMARSLEAALARPEGDGRFGIARFRARESWAFAPAILWRANRYVREADFVTLHSAYSFPVLAGYLLARLHGVPYGLWPHGVLLRIQRRFGARKKWLYDRLFTRRILNNASVIVYSSRKEQSESADLHPNVPSVIIPDGMDLEDFSKLPPRGRFRARYLNGFDGPLVVFLARLNGKKGIELLIRSMRLVVSRHPGTRLAIIGGPDPPSYIERVYGWLEECGMTSATVVTGNVSAEGKLEALADADVFMLPSEGENFGYSVFEAMACGVPVVVSDVLDYGAAIAAAGAGFAEPRDPERFAEAALRLIRDPALRAGVGEQGKRFVQSYSSTQTGIDLERTFESIIHRRPLPLDLTRTVGAPAE